MRVWQRARLARSARIRQAISTRQSTSLAGGGGRKLVRLRLPLNQLRAVLAGNSVSSVTTTAAPKAAILGAGRARAGDNLNFERRNSPGSREACSARAALEVGARELQDEFGSLEAETFVGASNRLPARKPEPAWLAAEQPGPAHSLTRSRPSELLDFAPQAPCLRLISAQVSKRAGGRAGWRRTIWVAWPGELSERLRDKSRRHEDKQQ